MRPIRKGRLVFGLSFLLVGVPALAGVTPGSGITGSTHDFTKTARSPAGGGTKLCGFCHFRDTGANQPNLPLSFWPAITQTQGGTRLPTNLRTWAGSSKLCLSCHAAPRHEPRRPLWSDERNPRNRLDGRTVADAPAAGAFDAVVPVMNEVHPVGIPYPYLRMPGTYNDITTGHAVDLSDYVPVPANVKLFTSRDDMVVAGAQVGETGMECATCHDIHNEHVRDSRLLRDTKKQLCFNCHDL